jgi:archaellum component FlaC
MTVNASDIHAHAATFRHYAERPAEIRDIFARATDEELSRFWLAIAEIADSAADMLEEVEKLQQQAKED